MDREPPVRPPGSSAAGRRVLLALACVGLGACASRPGHYYQDDGPPDHPPAGLAQTPDAVPRVEPLNPRANRPYAALGRSYTPDTSDAPFEQRGMASWYGRQYHGNPTASGEPYDMFAMTAAHPTLPIPSYARVTRMSDGRSVIVRINDRGPFVQDRVIDLSYAAATRLGIVGPGSGEVSVRKITARDIAMGNYGPPATGVAAAPAAPVASATPKPVPVAQAPGLPTEAAIASREVASADSPAPPAEPVLASTAPTEPAATSTTGIPDVVPGTAALGVASPLPASVSSAAPAPQDSVPQGIAPRSAADAPPQAGPAAEAASGPNAKSAPAANPALAPSPASERAATTPAGSTAASPPASPPALPAASPAASPAALPAASPAASSAAPTVPAGAQSPGAGDRAKWSVQLGAFAQLAHAEALRDQVAAALARTEASSLPPENRQPRIEFDGRLHHVLVGAFGARSAAQSSARALQRLLSRDTTLYRH